MNNVSVSLSTGYASKSIMHRNVDQIVYEQYGVKIFILDEGEYFYPYNSFLSVFKLNSDKVKKEENDELIDFPDYLSKDEQIDQVASIISNTYNKELNEYNIPEENRAFTSGFINNHCVKIAKQIINLNR